MFFLSLSISLVIYKKLYSFQELTGSNSEQESGTSSEQQPAKDDDLDRPRDEVEQESRTLSGRTAGEVEQVKSPTIN